MEILGHRLRIWTLPRGVEDPPPISLRAKLLTLVGLAVAAVILVTVVIPAIDGSKGRAATRNSARTRRSSAASAPVSSPSRRLTTAAPA